MKSVALHNRLTNVLLKSLTFLLFFAISFSSFAQDAVDEARQKEGRKLFKNFCGSCHKLDKKLIGPPLGGVEGKYENDWLKKWIKNNAELIASGDPLAAEASLFDSSQMTVFPQLSDKQIDDILYYTTVGDPLPPGGESPIEPKEEKVPWLIYILASAIIVAFLIIASLLKTISELKGAPKTPGALGTLHEVWDGIKQNTFLHVLAVIFGLLVTAYFLFGTLFKIGVEEGYQPIQPIAFSHKVHAGDNKIDCQYCHSSAKHSKTSGIPTVNVCMNCHKFISEVASDTKVVMDDVTLGKEDLDKEIAKVYAAAGWDAEKLEYTGETKPVKWVRVHNLPDFAYFNHSQHVTVAGLKCQKCHGPVEEMEELYQHSPLTMGWCIDCHKETKVDLKGNEYYKKIHEDLAAKFGVDQVTIAQLGGKECGKCHY
ncbi:quinol:cytochrome c oxidoreductase pentaheme cytochrome subunit [Lutibacter sp. Hel_I_33_5]|uniref:c-type cytochrome n=1 Tax=Lutibacter sp. Hel_I_33_5 TaxID=1566289 RepID=UPI0011AAFFD1|nr:c-type cytochrome [Lutibacter sp. Hel_I_33_5]TVZ56114.1 quinol:cytochrome c oxidoreductase pentaheme cytochrome subunit [Lutibacter sp. Hel_I_33_5]